MNDMDEFRQIFFTECTELLTDMEERLMTLEPGSVSRDQLNAIFRCAHSIKGGSGAFGLNAIMGFTHKLEALLDELRTGALSPSRAIIDTLLKSSDIVTRMLDAAQAGQEPGPEFGADVAAALQAHISGEIVTSTTDPVNETAPAAQPLASYDIFFAPHFDLYRTGNEPLLILRELRRLGETRITATTFGVPPLDAIDPTECHLSWRIELAGTVSEDAVWDVFEFVRDNADIEVEVLSVTTDMVRPDRVREDVNETPVPVPPVSVEPAGTDLAPAAKAATSIRVDLEKVDRLVNMVGELVITEAMLRAQARLLPVEHTSALMRQVDELSHHTRELQESVMAVRMQPVKSVFSRMPRTVRDTAAQLGKEIHLVTLGEATEVDKTVIEQLSDPLTHMIRNSCDHGIESPEKRIAAGKPAQGIIKLSAYHRSGRIIIEIADDGAGINRERVLGKAREKGLVAADANLSDEEIDHLIFLPGFSTAEAVTAVSGRGVGMDVVRRNIESLGGTVRIANHPGKGSIFTVSLPLTLAILDGMIVRVGTECYIVPITSIIETLRPKAEDVHAVQGRGDVINVRGEFVPLLYLSDIFGIQGAEHRASKALCVLVESGSSKLGLVVDELVGQQQIVIKSLEANADPVRGISGATILGDGKVSLILEINELKAIAQPAAALAA